MNFWDRVDNMLEIKGMTRKELCMLASITMSDFRGKSNKEDRSPSADKAVRIANALGTTVEYLVSGSISSQKDIFANLDTLYQYEPTIRKLASIPKQQRTPIEKMIEDISASYSTDDNKKK